MSVKDIMTKNVVSLRDSDYLCYAAKIFRENKFKACPVVDKDNKVIGIMSERDLLDVTRHRTCFKVNLLDKISLLDPSITETLASISLDPSKITETLASRIDFNEFEKIAKEIEVGQVSEHMAKKPYTVNPEDPISKVVSLMVEKKINHLPVVDKEGKLLGIIARSDIIKAISQARIVQAPIIEKIR